MNQTPFRRLVILGESNAYGMCASRPAFEWNQVLAELLRAFQDGELEILNRALPSAVISPRSPGYEMAARPSLIERYRQHCIELHPDLVIISQGLNDMRSGMALQDYMADLDQIVADIKTETGAIIVLLGIYHQIYGQGVNDPTVMPDFAKGSDVYAWIFNQAMRLLAIKRKTLFVDALAVLGGADWLLHPDCCHLNDLGHLMIGQAIFHELARNCSGLADNTQRLIEYLHVSTANTGGTDTNEEIQSLWQSAAARFDIVPLPRLGAA